MTNEDLSQLRWRKASYSGNSGNCVEVGTGSEDGSRFVRDTKDRSGGAFRATSEQWATFLDAIKGGQL